MSDQALPVDHPLSLVSRLYRAVKYVLDCSQTDPNLGYYIGPGTQAFAELCRAESAYTGRPPADVEKARGVDLQPEYRRRAPDVVQLRLERDEARLAAESGRDWREAAKKR